MSRLLETLGLAGLLWLGGGVAAAQGPHGGPPCQEVPAGAAASGPLNLNTASEEQLLELPGIGPSRARAIIAFREEHGGFQSVSQLLRIKGFGRAMLRRLRPLVLAQPAG